MKIKNNSQEVFSKTFLEEKYAEGYTQEEIGKLVGKAKNTINYWFKKYNIPTNKDKFRKYPVNHNYFDKWSANMAYILGFVTCDGWISDGAFRFDLNIQDKNLLDFIMKEICPTGKVITRNRYDKRTNKIYYQCSCYICSTVLVKKLNDFGIVANKTGKEVIIKDIPSKFIPDYLRGILDGDGTVLPRAKGKYLYPKFSISSSSRSFLEDLNFYYFDNLGKVRSKGKENCFTLDFESRSKIIKLLSWIYNGNFCLQRKYQKFLDILEYDKKMSTNLISIGTRKGLNTFN